MKKKFLRAIICATLLCGMTAALPLRAAAASAFDTPYTTAFDPTTLFTATLNRTIDERGIYQQIKQGLLFKTVDQFSLMQICDRGYEMPQSVSQRLYEEGYICSYLYKRINHIAITPADMAKVFDANYYLAMNPDVAAACGNDEAAIFGHFITTGMTEGRQGRESFDVKKYKENHPALAARFGPVMVAYYLYYIFE
ncbi:MAG: hypothetical protein IJT32_01570 [Lachnospiraceae bacterium]|nr:hypothetical protein [Lachnospiraceae bacterium]